METNNNVQSPRSIIYNLDPGNKKCVDCGRDNPTEVSINHGILICENCAIVHSLFGTAISYVKSVDSEWDDYLLSYILLGGNTLFINSLEKMKVNPELSVEEKYRTYALDYYRRNLKNKVMNGSEIPIDYVDPNACISNPKNSFCEFDNYKIEKNEKAEEVNINNTIEKKENTTEVNINSTNKGNTNEVTFNNNKILVMQQPKNVKEFFAMVGNEFKKAGHYFKEKTPNQLKQNAHIIGNGFKDMMENLKVKMSLSKKKEEDNKNVSKSQPSTQSEYYNINEIDDMNIPVIHSEVKQETKMYTNA